MLFPYDPALTGVDAAYRQALVSVVGEEFAAALDASCPEVWLQALLAPALERAARQDAAAVRSGELPPTWWRPTLQLEVSQWPHVAGPDRGVRIMSCEGELTLSCYPLLPQGPWEWDGMIRYSECSASGRLVATSDVGAVSEAVDVLHDLAVQAGKDIYAGRGSRSPLAAAAAGAHPAPSGAGFLRPLPPALGSLPVRPAGPYELIAWLMEPAMIAHPDVRMRYHYDPGYDDACWDLSAPGRDTFTISYPHLAYRDGWDGLCRVYRAADRWQDDRLEPDQLVACVLTWLAGPPWPSA